MVIISFKAGDFTVRDRNRPYGQNHEFRHKLVPAHRSEEERRRTCIDDGRQDFEVPSDLLATANECGSCSIHYLFIYFLYIPRELDALIAFIVTTILYLFRT